MAQFAQLLWNGRPKMKIRQSREFRNWSINIVIDGDPSTGYQIRIQTIRRSRVSVREIVKVDQIDVNFPNDLEAFKAAFAACRIKIESKGEVCGYPFRLPLGPWIGS